MPAFAGDCWCRARGFPLHGKRTWGFDAYHWRFQLRDGFMWLRHCPGCGGELDLYGKAATNHDPADPPLTWTIVHDGPIVVVSVESSNAAVIAAALPVVEVGGRPDLS